MMKMMAVISGPGLIYTAQYDSYITCIIPNTYINLTGCYYSFRDHQTETQVTCPKPHDL